jgi:hypothetical protein
MNLSALWAVSQLGQVVVCQSDLEEVLPSGQVEACLWIQSAVCL